jgi:DHA3 family multidrug efflux protein-like MFS transporter
MKPFYLLLANTVIATVNNYTVWFALIFFLYLETQSVIVTSIISGLHLVATAFTGFWFGNLVDQYKKKTAMIISSIFSLVVYVIGFILYETAATDGFKDTSSPLIWIFIPLLLSGVIAGNVRNIALPALVPLMVDKNKIDNANGLVGMATGVAFFIVSVISGILVGHSGMFLVFIMAIVLTVATILHLLTLDIPENGASVQTMDSIKSIDIRGTLKIIVGIPGLLALILFTTFNNFLGGVFMSLMDAYGLSLVSVQAWGLIWGALSVSFIIGGVVIARKGLGKSPLKSLFLANIVIWTVCIFFTIQPSIILLALGMFIYLAVVPVIEAAEHTIIQKVVPQDRLGRVFGFAQSVEQAASPLTAFAIGPITQLIFIPFMTTGAGVDLIGSWFGTGPARGMALVFIIAGVIGLCVTLVAMRSRFYFQLSKRYSQGVS